MALALHGQNNTFFRHGAQNGSLPRIVRSNTLRSKDIEKAKIVFDLHRDLVLLHHRTHSHIHLPHHLLRRLRPLHPLDHQTRDIPVQLDRYGSYHSHLFHIPPALDLLVRFHRSLRLLFQKQDLLQAHCELLRFALPLLASFQHPLRFHHLA